MRKICVSVLALLMVALPLFGAMSDARAMQMARTLWGDLAAIGTIRCQIDGPGCTSSNWTRMVGIKTIGCRQNFTVLGTGFNTWDAAFADYNVHLPAIAGPLRGTVNFTAKALDDTAVTKMDFIIDSTSLNSVIQNSPATQWDVSVPVNTTLLATGLHAVCATAEDAAGNRGQSVAILFTVNQSVASGPPQIRVNSVDLRPSVVMPNGLL